MRDFWSCAWRDPDGGYTGVMMSPHLGPLKGGSQKMWLSPVGTGSPQLEHQAEKMPLFGTVFFLGGGAQPLLCIEREKQRKEEPCEQKEQMWCSVLPGS